MLSRKLWTIAILLAACSSPVKAQEGHIGHGHDKWHDLFYRHLQRNDTKTSCCNLADCRPTKARMIDDHYEVMIDGVWVSVPSDKINKVTAPDMGAHVCAPVQQGTNKGVIYCVVLPPDT
jgi:hypothetical protein